MKNSRLLTKTPSIFSSTFTTNTSLPNINIPNPQIAASLSSTLQHYINSDHPIHGQKIHTHIIKTGFIPNTNIFIKLLILHVKSGCLRYANKVFDEMHEPTVSAYNYMISGCVKNGFVFESMDFARRLSYSGLRPDEFTFSMILKASTNGNVLLRTRNLGKQVHAQIVRFFVEPDDVLCTVLVDSYVKSGNVDYARRVFNVMSERNVICSTSMISGYMNQGLVSEAEFVFDKTIEKDVVVYNAMIEGYSKVIETAEKGIRVYIDMLRLGFTPTISTFASVVGACSILSAFEITQQIQGQLMKTPLFTDVKMGSALIDTYSKCGKIEDSRRVFDYMLKKNVFSWTSMIDGYGKNGDPEKALKLFYNMRREARVEPNFVTFLSAISACGHAGLVEKGQDIFDSIERDYSMKPRMEHYACMVDLFGRAGRLDRALEFVRAMPEKPNSDVWAALLSACKLHDEVEMAKLASRELFKLNQESRPGAYMALSNTLAAAGRWDNVGELRDLMKVKKIAKDTGFSWVGTDSGLEGFYVGINR